MSTNAAAAAAHVRQREECIELCFTLLNQARCLTRPRSEPLERTIRRIQLFYDNHHEHGQALSKRELRRRAKHLNTKQMHDTASTTTKVMFLNRTQQPIDLQMPLHQAVQEAVEFTVNDHRYQLHLNQPKVVSLRIEAPSMVGIPVFALAETEFCVPAACEYQWYRDELEKNDTTTVLSTTPYYTPTLADVGSKLRVVCRPMDSVHESVEAWTEPVQAAPNRSQLKPRFELAELPKPDEAVMRVMSYNVLYNRYSTSLKRYFSCF